MDEREVAAGATAYPEGEIPREEAAGASLLLHLSRERPRIERAEMAAGAPGVKFSLEHVEHLLTRAEAKGFNEGFEAGEHHAGRAWPDWYDQGAKTICGWLIPKLQAVLDGDDSEYSQAVGDAIRAALEELRLASTPRADLFPRFAPGEAVVSAHAQGNIH